MKHNKYPSRHTGFTLVELAIVLVIIGLILGMAFKGRDLIDGAKVKSADAGVNKIISAINIYYERYGAYPGDGCAAAANPANPPVCTPANRNGVLDATEAGLLLTVLQNASLISLSDLHTPFGANWAATLSTGAAPTTNGRVYLTLANPVSGAASTMDERLACSMDQQFDDSASTTGTIRTAGTAFGTTVYNAGTDCWTAYTGNTATLFVQLLP